MKYYSRRMSRTSWAIIDRNTGKVIDDDYSSATEVALSLYELNENPEGRN